MGSTASAWRPHRRRAAGRGAALAGDAARPIGRHLLLPGGNLVAQSWPCLRQPAAPGRDDRDAIGDFGACARSSACCRQSRIAYFCYAYNLFGLGPVLILFFINLLVMGWWVALGYRLAAVPLWRRRRGSGLDLGLRHYPAGLRVLSRHRAAGLAAAFRLGASGRPCVCRACAQRCCTTASPGTSWRRPACSISSGWRLSIAVFSAQFRAARIRGALISIGE